jgi:hypothetical protein
MHAAVLHALGKPPRFEEFPDPTPGEGEVLINVSAAALKPVDKQMATGTHYASTREFPVVCGMDGVGRLDDGTRVFFGGARRPYGEAAVRRDGRAHCGSASSMFFGPWRTGRCHGRDHSQSRCVGLAVHQAQCEARLWRNRPDPRRHRSHGQAGGTDRQNLGRGTRRCGRTPRQ